MYRLSLMQFLVATFVGMFLLTGCSPASADVCEKQSGITLKWVPPQQSILKRYPQLADMVGNAEMFRQELIRLGFDLHREESAAWAFRCDRRDILKVTFADYALAAPDQENQEGYMIGYGENGEIVAVANRFNYRAP